MSDCWKKKYDDLLNDYRQLKEYIINADEDDLKSLQVALRVVDEMGD